MPMHVKLFVYLKLFQYLKFSCYSQKKKQKKGIIAENNSRESA
jgi:hypothetical protein